MTGLPRIFFYFADFVFQASSVLVYFGFEFFADPLSNLNFFTLDKKDLYGIII